MDTINIKIDNKNFQVAEGTTILEAAKSVGVNIPTLCYMHLHHLNTTHKPTHRCWLSNFDELFKNRPLLPKGRFPFWSKSCRLAKCSTPGTRLTHLFS